MEDMLAQRFGTIAGLIRAQAELRPEHPAIVCAGPSLSYAGFDALLDRVAAALQRQGVAPLAPDASAAALAAIEIVSSLPRSDIGKVLKRVLREAYAGAAQG